MKTLRTKLADYFDVDAGSLVLARGGFWKGLERAATNMELVARASQLRRRFRETLERNIDEDSE